MVLVACKQHINQSESRTKTKHSEHFTPPPSPPWLTINYEPTVPVCICMKPNDMTVLHTLPITASLI